MTGYKSIGELMAEDYRLWCEYQRDMVSREMEMLRKHPPTIRVSPDDLVYGHINQLSPGVVIDWSLRRNPYDLAAIRYQERSNDAKA